MLDTDLERDLKSFDYSTFSSVRESLLRELLQKHRADNGTRIPSLSQTILAKHMTEEELDCVAAAGNPHLDMGKNRQKDLVPTGRI